MCYPPSTTWRFRCGNFWLSSYDVSWNMWKDEVSIQGHTFPLFAKGSKRRSVRRVVLAQDTLIPTRARANVSTDIIHGTLRTSSPVVSGDQATRPRRLKNGVYTARTVVLACSHDARVRQEVLFEEGPSTNSPRLIRRPAEFNDYVP